MRREDIQQLVLMEGMELQAQHQLRELFLKSNQLKHLQHQHQLKHHQDNAPAEVFDVEAELSTLNKLETQAVQIISENPWRLFQAGVLTLRNNKGERVTNPHGEPVLIVREFLMLSTSQQEDLRAQGITRHVWEKYPLAGHSVLFFTRSWEIGRMTAYVKNYSTVEEKEIYQQKLK